MQNNLHYFCETSIVLKNYILKIHDIVSLIFHLKLLDEKISTKICTKKNSALVKSTKKK